MGLKAESTELTHSPLEKVVCSSSNPKQLSLVFHVLNEVISKSKQ